MVLERKLLTFRLSKYNFTVKFIQKDLYVLKKNPRFNVRTVRIRLILFFLYFHHFNIGFSCNSLIYMENFKWIMSISSLNIKLYIGYVLSATNYSL